ncbi:MAG TPA: M23 family metallopeptidase [Candidatus Sulfopaludibacter sp.]|nr:M23 family metallopeptidase [Candidatus Sulfopaludibacter sp.]
MKQEYFVLVLAHSLRGRLRRIHVPHTAVYTVLALALLGCFSVLGFVASYGRMALKVANYNALKREADNLRNRYQNLQKVVSQTNQQLATLEIYAKEVTVAYGIKQKLEGPSDLAAEGKLVPTFAESLEDYTYLRSTKNLGLQGHRARGIFTPAPSQLNLWPVEGRLIGAFGRRTDPFSGEGAMHMGVDIGAPTGTPVRATADGVVVYAQVESGYGKLIRVDHGGGIQTYYAHLSAFYVNVGQDVHRGELIGAVGTTGRVTAPHLHYEVRMGGAPMNPARFLANASVYQPLPVHKDPFQNE